MVNKNKRGELTSRQLIIIIILIVSFAIILAFFFILDLGGDIDKESCRNSVMMRGIFSKIPVVGKSFISLKCKTQDVCLSMGGDCEEEVDETIEVEDKEDLIKEMVNLLADCWWMMGEGKVDYDGEGSCAICYKVYFDDEIRGDEEIKEQGGISYLGLYESMINKVPNEDMTYLFYLYGLNSVPSVRNKISRDSDNKIDINNDKINPNEEYVIVTSVLGGKSHNPPLFVKFSANELNSKMGCSKYVTEV